MAEGTGRLGGSAVCTRKMVRLLAVYGHYFFNVMMLRMRDIGRALVVYLGGW
jgi:hypothetical protein